MIFFLAAQVKQDSIDLFAELGNLTTKFSSPAEVTWSHDERPVANVRENESSSL